MKDFKTIAIYSSGKNEKIAQISDQVEEILKNLSRKFFHPISSVTTQTTKTKPVTDKYVLKNADLIIAIGGDGTLLSSARKFGFKGIPIMGINLGNLGFLTDVDPDDLTHCINEILSKKYTIDSRFFLEAKVNKDKKIDIALNEIVIHSGSVAQLGEYQLYINNKFVYRQRADGLIISTPTGSTAYSLSGNGPIVHPKSKSIILLPMFPHSLNARPLIVDEDVNIKVIVKENSYLSLDSHNNLKLKPLDEVHIKKSISQLKLVHPNDHDFFTACRNKLGWSLGLPEK
jgi:NAD+ kinase